MTKVRVKLAAAVAAIGALAVVGASVASDGDRIREKLTGFEEVPAVSTEASGKINLKVQASQDNIHYKLSYADLEGDVLQAHIHLGQRSVNGGIAAFLCSNLGNGPAGTQECPPAPATVEGDIGPDQVVGPAAQGIARGEFAELVRAIRAGVTYANVHSSKFEGGEIRAQLEGDSDD